MPWNQLGVFPGGGVDLRYQAIVAVHACLFQGEYLCKLCIKLKRRQGRVVFTSTTKVTPLMLSRSIMTWNSQAHTGTSL